MKQLTCEMCGGTNLVKDGGVFVCQTCGCKYTIEEAKRMMIEGTVDVQGTVKVDNTAFIEKYLTNARRALNKKDWEEVEKYYNLVEQNVPDNIEAVFFSSFGKMVSLLVVGGTIQDLRHRVSVLENSMSVINDYFETTSEDKEEVLNRICEAIATMNSYNLQAFTDNGSVVFGTTTLAEINKVREAFLIELNQIKDAHPELSYIDELINKVPDKKKCDGCYVATAVYGSYDCPQVWTLRRYRDYTLARTWHGRVFIRTYYAISPTLVRWFGHTEWFKHMWKGKLDRMVADLQARGVEDTPYEDRKW